MISLQYNKRFKKIVILNIYQSSYSSSHRFHIAISGSFDFAIFRHRRLNDSTEQSPSRLTSFKCASTLAFVVITIAGRHPFRQFIRIVKVPYNVRFTFNHTKRKLFYFITQLNIRATHPVERLAPDRSPVFP